MCSDVGCQQGCSSASTGPEATLTRRKALGVAALTVAALAAADGLLAAAPAEAAASWVNLGKATTFKVGHAKIIDPNQTPIRGLDRPVIIVRKSKTAVLALDARCTHQGCTVMNNGSGYLCPCHASTYTQSGKVTGGLAPTNLRTLKARIHGTSMQVLINPATF